MTNPMLRPSTLLKDRLHMLDKLLFQYIGNSKKYITVSILLMMAKVIGSFLLALSLGRTIQDLFSSATSHVGVNIFIFLSGFLLRSGSLYLVTRYQTKITGKVKTNLRSEMIAKAMRIGPSYLNYTSTSNMINMGSDTSTTENYYGRFCPNFWQFAMSLVTFLVLLSISHLSAIVFLLLSYYRSYSKLF